MENTETLRPDAPEKKIRTSSDFELCYLRHQYFRRVKYNPTESEMAPYMKIVEHLTKNTFFTYYNLFKTVGMYHDDVLNIGRVHLVSFLGLYDLDKREDKKKEFSEKFEKKEYRVPIKSDFDQKNKANFTMFFKQRMEDLVRVCRQKVRNIKGKISEEYAVFYGKEKLPKYLRRLLKNHEEYGYKKLDFSVFKSIRKKANVGNTTNIFEFDGIWYVALPVEQKNLDIEDLIGSDSNPYDNKHNMRPDQIYDEFEQEKQQKLFNKKSNYRKRVTLRNFIAKNRNRTQYKEEIATARKLLKRFGG